MDQEIQPGAGCKGGVLILTQTAEQWPEKESRRRGQTAGQAREGAGYTDLDVGASLRLRWMEGQLRDPELLPLLQKKAAIPGGFRRGGDGLLEKAVSPQDWVRAEWAPVVPADQATATLAWRK